MVDPCGDQEAAHDAAGHEDGKRDAKRHAEAQPAAGDTRGGLPPKVIRQVVAERGAHGGSHLPVKGSQQIMIEQDRARTRPASERLQPLKVDCSCGHRPRHLRTLSRTSGRGAGLCSSVPSPCQLCRPPPFHAASHQFTNLITCLGPMRVNFVPPWTQGVKPGRRWQMLQSPRCHPRSVFTSIAMLFRRRLNLSRGRLASDCGCTSQHRKHGAQSAFSVCWDASAACER